MRAAAGDDGDRGLLAGLTRLVEVQIEPWCMKPVAGTSRKVGFGVGSLLSAARTGITGRSVGDLPSALDVLVVGLLPVALPWLAWLGLRVSRG